jgi:hypothetical protein
VQEHEILLVVRDEGPASIGRKQKVLLIRRGFEAKRLSDDGVVTGFAQPRCCVM